MSFPTKRPFPFVEAVFWEEDLLELSVGNPIIFDRMNRIPGLGALK
jgi:hypothetical protein